MPWERLSLITNGNTALQKELLQLFMQSSTRCFNTLSEHTAETQEEIWDKALHELKGASANLGINSIAMLCTESQASAPLSEDQKHFIISELQENMKEVQAFLEGL